MKPWRWLGRMMSMNSDNIVCEGVTIPFRYCRSRRKTIGVTVRPDKSVSVRAPLRTPLPEIRGFVCRKAAWIMKVWQRFDRLAHDLVKEHNGAATVRFQGREYPLCVRRGAAEAVSLNADQLVVHTPLDYDGEKLAGLINTWYCERAVELFGERARECHCRMEAELLPFPVIAIRNMKSRWGSYSYRTGRMSLNLKLVKVPLPCLDYVIIHELCHIKVPNHGPRFWKLVSRYVPDHAELRRQLRNHVTVY